MLSCCVLSIKAASHAFVKRVIIPLCRLCAFGWRNFPKCRPYSLPLLPSIGEGLPPWQASCSSTGALGLTKLSNSSIAAPQKHPVYVRHSSRSSIPADHELAAATEQHVTQQLAGIAVSVLAAAVAGLDDTDSQGGLAEAGARPTALDVEDGVHGHQTEGASGKLPSAADLLGPLLTSAGARTISLTAVSHLAFQRAGSRGHQSTSEYVMTPAGFAAIHSGTQRSLQLLLCLLQRAAELPTAVQQLLARQGLPVAFAAGGQLPPSSSSAADNCSTNSGAELRQEAHQSVLCFLAVCCSAR